MITLRAREAFRALCATCWFVRPQRVKCTPRYLTSFDAKMLCPFTLICTSVFREVLVLNGTNTVIREENPFTCIKWTTPSTASWNSFMLFHTRAVCVETSDVGVRPYRQVVGVHGQHYLSLHCSVHVVDHDVEQQGGDH